MNDFDPEAAAAAHGPIDQQIAASTSALLRTARQELEQLRRDYNAELAARVAAEKERDELARRASDLEQVREELRQKTLQHAGCLDDYHQWESEKADFVEASLALKAENARLSALVVRGPGRYHLTDKGRAVTDG